MAALVTKNFGLATQKLSFVTISALSNELKTEAWKDLASKDSQLYKFMTCGIFKNQDTSGSENLDIRRLKIFGLLHC